MKTGSRGLCLVAGTDPPQPHHPYRFPLQPAALGASHCPRPSKTVYPALKRGVMTSARKRRHSSPGTILPAVSARPKKEPELAHRFQPFGQSRSAAAGSVVMPIATDTITAIGQFLIVTVLTSHSHARLRFRGAPAASRPATRYSMPLLRRTKSRLTECSLKP